VTFCVYPADPQSEPDATVSKAISNRLADGSLEVIAGSLYCSSDGLCDKVAPYVDAIVAGRIVASEFKSEEPVKSNEALLISMMALPQGPWRCRGRCGEQLTWPGLCRACYDKLGVIDKMPLDAYSSVPKRFRRCRFELQDWQRGIPQKVLSAALELSRKATSIELEGDRGIELGAAIFHERLKVLRNNADARYVDFSTLTRASIAALKDLPLVLLDTPDPRVASALSKYTQVLACNCRGTTIAEKLCAW
jgi:hypothetical protein